MLGFAYDEHLTEKEAEQLACAIKLFLNDAKLANMIILWGEKDLELAIKFLKKFINKEGGIIRVPYSKIKDEIEKEDSTGNNPNKRALHVLLVENKVTYQEGFQFVKDDLSVSIGRAILRYAKYPDGTILGLIRDTYTFLDTKNKGLDAYFPWLGVEGFFCCWRGGEWVKDTWMGDLETYGLAKSFQVHIDWQFTPMGWE